MPSLIKKVLGASNQGPSSSSSSSSSSPSTPSSTSKATSKSTSKPKPKPTSPNNKPTKTATSTSTTKTTTIHTRPNNPPTSNQTQIQTQTPFPNQTQKPPNNPKIHISGPGSNPLKNTNWAGDSVPIMRPGMVPAIVGEEQLSGRQMERMGIVPGDGGGRWVRVGGSRTVTKGTVTTSTVTRTTTRSRVVGWSEVSKDGSRLPEHDPKDVPKDDSKFKKPEKENEKGK